MEKITPRVDIAFKKIFGVEENKDLLISLINSIVSEEDQVSEVTLLNPYNLKNFKQDKWSILDIKAMGTDGKRFNVEIQICNEADYNKRALYYWAKLYTEQLKETEGYDQLSKAIGIHILNFTSIPESKKYHNVFRIVEKDNGIHYFKDLELHTIELRKFTDIVSNELSDIVSKIKTSLDRWVAFLTKYHVFDKNHLPENLKNTNLEKALTVLEVMNFNEEEREEYENHLKWLRIQTNTIKKYEQDARAEGKAEGKAEGRAEIAKKMLKRGIAVEIIIEDTGLTYQELEAIKNEQ